MNWKGGKRMHSFLRAIGFSDLKKELQIDSLIQMVIENPDHTNVYEDSSENNIVEFRKEFAYHCGISVCGEYLDDDEFRMEYFYPYFQGDSISTEEDIEIEKHSDKNSFAGVCDDIRLGITLIFYLQNAQDFMKNSIYKIGNINRAPVILSALSIEGKIIFPVLRDKEYKKNHIERLKHRNYLISAAKDGDEDAIENLTLEDIDAYSAISKRMQEEDVLSIVESSIMPYGIESDQYAVIGEILNIKSIENCLTKEESYILTIDAKDIVFDVCILKSDLLGEPEIGRRFKGNIWMQGYMDFDN